ncbi:DNA polymerase III subunit delta' [Staphylococcus muscae]|uniref:DNA polymerase III subunit delta n=1 Tax=Staphylococcus muscae TaxID=1294 RepID=A0A240BSL1_9STAP|nr:DNA polymerase III subunit delta' [Staphylococcus muscae]AVQ34074.1 DNA polymerase III subunit delta' [Staphylococcus muscae]PNZ03112.1 DNA polymerase III subunit delta' [Staphylococcus muscae]GGA95130.1 DNA polymerase III subunit delta' [Staphylococcus muscae]SNV98695.1 DNA polymerase III subunit delta' [Staphylococcus muscae]
MAEIERLTAAHRNGKLSHAYLFEGNDAEAMSATALAFAQLILCQNHEVCRTKVQMHNHPDFHYVQTDEVNIKKDQIEALVHHMNRLPIESDYKVYVIQDFEKLTVQGENSILKFLEEPPEKTVAILLSTKPEQILDTIHSRCQHVYFKPMSRADFVSYLEMHEDFSRPIAALMSTYTTQVDVARQLAENYELTPLRQVTIQWCDKLVRQPDMALIGVIDLLKHAKNRQLQQLVLSAINAYFQDILYTKVGMPEKIIFTELEESYQEMVHQLNYRQLTHVVEVITEAHKKLMQNVNPTLVFEQIVIKMKG